MRAEASRTASRLGFSAALLGLLLALVINHHWFYPDFNLVPGDQGDTRLVIFTLEHWFSAFKGQESILVLNMFYPDQVALGYADGLFLFALPYALFRALGLDYFTSYQALFVCMTIIGYAAWLILLRKALRLNPAFAALGAVLLTSLNALQQQAQIGKLTAFNLYPVLIGLLVIFAATAKSRGWMPGASLAGFAALLGMLFFTSYYPAWFFAFTLVIFALVVLVASVLRRGFPATTKTILGFVAAHRWQLSISLGILLLSLVPFALTYAPVVMSDSKRSFDLVLEFTPRPRDIINVSPQNYVWSPVLRRLGFGFGDREVQMGSPLIMLGLFLLFLARLVTSRFQKAPPGTGRHLRLLLGLSASAVVIFALIIQVHGISLWYLIYAAVPGASALRALGRYLIIIDMIMVVAVVYGLDQFYGAQTALSARRRPLILAGVAVVAALLVAEQLNGSPYRLDKAGQLAFLQRFQTPPPTCKAFYIHDPGSADLPVGYYQLDAMMITMKVGIPTVNGYSGFAPSPAFTMVPQGAEYKYRVLQWLRQNGAEVGICELDEQTTAYRNVNVSVELPQEELLYRDGYLNAFSSLYSAAGKFLADGNLLSNLYPQYLEEHGYLESTFGYQSGARYKWMQDRYWIGERACNRGPCFGIGVVATYTDIKAIIDQYGGRAEKIFFPYPEPYVAERITSGGVTGELLMIFSGDELKP